VHRFSPKSSQNGKNSTARNKFKSCAENFAESCVTKMHETECIYKSSATSSCHHHPKWSLCQHRIWIRCDTAVSDKFEDSDDDSDYNRRRTLLSFGLVSVTMMAVGEPAQAIRRQSSTFLVTAKNATSAESFRMEPLL
jgi:hypothetical protein